MSVNQKQVVTGGQQHRFASNATYNPIPQSSRHSSNDPAYISTGGGYAPQGTTQSSGQAHAIRMHQGIQPNQSSAPSPEVKVSTGVPPINSVVYPAPPPQQRNQSHFYPRNSTTQSAQPTRMSNHPQQRNPPSMYTMQHYSPVPIPSGLFPIAATPFANRPMSHQYGQYYIQGTPQFFQPAAVGMNFPWNPMIQRSAQPVPNTGAPNTPAVTSTMNVMPHIMQNIPGLTQPLAQAAPSQPQLATGQRKGPRPNALAIIDPDTGVDKLKLIYEEANNESASNESSARETPQPQPAKEVQATFAKQVALAISNDTNSLTASTNLGGSPTTNNSNIPSMPISSSVSSNSILGDNQLPPHVPSALSIDPSTHMGYCPDPAYDSTTTQIYQNHQAVHPPPILLSNIASPIGGPAIPSMQTVSNNRVDPVLQHNVLPPTQACEYYNTNVPAVIPNAGVDNFSKDTIPVVSANSATAEITLDIKKDRDSPAKSKKHQTAVHYRDNVPVASTTLPTEQISELIATESSHNSSNALRTETKSSSVEINTDTKKVSEKSTKVEEKRKREQKSGDAKINNAPSVNITSKRNSSADNSNEVPSERVATRAPVTSSSSETKPKSGQQPHRIKHQDVPKQHAPNTNQSKNIGSTNAATNPTQPAKSTNKSQKRYDINQKGASKEGTDMDAFSDSIAKVIQNDAKTAPSSTKQLDVHPLVPDAPQAIAKVETSPEVNTNNVEQPLEVTATVVSLSPEEPKDAAPKTFTDNLVTTKDSISTTPLISSIMPIISPTVTTKVDVTSIVKEVPKPYTAFDMQQHCDETDRGAVMGNHDQLVHARNEINKNGGSEATISTIATKKTDLPYKEGQWAPHNQEGKKKYEREFLLALRDTPNSRKKPDTLLVQTCAINDDRPRHNDSRFSSSSSRTDYSNPPFSNYGMKNSSQKAVLATKRNSQSGKTSTNKGSKSQIIKVTLAGKEDVKLNEVENAWRPARFAKGEKMTEDELKTEELYKKVRGVLNKLTPQKFATLVGQIRMLNIDTVERLQGVIDLVFEKAVDEPNFSVAYAEMCNEVSNIHLYKDGLQINFKKLLLNRCQMEFEKQSIDETERNTLVQVIEECSDPEKRKELIFNLEEYDRKIRMKSVGTIRFIGELFKKRMLTVSIMTRCLNKLLETPDEEHLECLCKLLTTIGKELQNQSVHLNDIFSTLASITQKRDGKISSRVRFMIQDVIDLRNNKWVPRRQDLNPKTMDQIQKEAENEQLQIQAMNMIPSRRDIDRNQSSLNASSGSRYGPTSGSSGMIGSTVSNPNTQLRPNAGSLGGSGLGVVSESGGMGNSMAGGNNKRSRNVADQEGWIQSSSRPTKPYQIHVDKLKSTIPSNEILGNRQTFGAWSRGSGVSAKQTSTPNSGSGYAHNSYSVLSDVDTDRSAFIGSRSSNNRSTYSSKGHSLERNFNKHSYDGRGSRSESQQRSNSSMPPPLAPNDMPYAAINLSSHNSSTSAMQKPMNVNNAQQTATGIPNIQISSNVPSIGMSSEDGLSHDDRYNELPSMTASTEYFKGDQLQRFCSTLFHEFATECSSFDDANADIRKKVNAEDLPEVLTDIVSFAFDKRGNDDILFKAGIFITKLVQAETLSERSYCMLLQNIFGCAEEWIIDIPLVWDYLAKTLLHQILENVLTLQKLRDCCQASLQNKRSKAKILMALLNVIKTHKGVLYLEDLWQYSGVKLTDFVEDEKIKDFVAETELTFLTGELSFDQVGKRLQNVLSNSTKEEIYKWIEEYIGPRVKEPRFIRTLAYSIFQQVIHAAKLDKERLAGYYALFHKYIDNDPALELECLLALQNAMAKLEFPQGALLNICQSLHDEGIISHECFIIWENHSSPADQEGKAVAVLQLKTFFTQLKEIDDDEDDGSMEGSSEEFIVT